MGRNHRLQLFAIALAFPILFCTSFAEARPGDLVPGFGDQGVIDSKVGDGLSQTPKDVARLNDGKFIVVGKSGPTPRSLIARYRPDGAVDETFGLNGVVETGGNGWDAVDIQSDGKIVVSGVQAADGVIARYLPDGTPDSDFGTNGRYEFASKPLLPDGEAERPIKLDLSSLSVAANGSILAAGTFFQCRDSLEDTCNNILIVSLTATGVPNPAYRDGSGLSLLDQRNSESSVFLDDDGSAVVITQTMAQDSDGIDVTTDVTRLNGDGQVDPAFGGTWTADNGPWIGQSSGAITFAPDGRLFVGAGQAVMRFGADGKYERSFNLVRLTDFLPHFASSFLVSDIEVDDRGRMVLAGAIGRGACDGRSKSGAVARITPGGKPDVTFGGDGLAVAWLGRPGDGCGAGETALNTTKLADNHNHRLLVIGQGPNGAQTRIKFGKLEVGESVLRECAGEPADFIGTDGPDELERARGVLVMLGGNDKVLKTNGATVCAGAGNDTVTWGGNQTRFFGGAGRDKLIGGVTKDQLHGGGGNDILKGLGESDVLTGDGGADTIYGGDLNDRLSGGYGQDRLFGGNGLDQLFGGKGRDYLDAGPRGPVVTDYRGRSTGLRIKVTRIGRRLANAKVKADLNCGRDGVKTILTTIRKIDVKRAAGKFRYRSPGEWRDDDDFPSFQDIDGSFHRGSVGGRLRLYEADHYYENYDCFTGDSPQDAWINFKAKRQPKPKQFAKQ